MVDGGGGFAAIGVLTCAANAEARNQNEEGESEEFHGGGGGNGDEYFSDSCEIGTGPGGLPNISVPKNAAHCIHVSYV
jgi:hypothetical protein